MELTGSLEEIKPYGESKRGGHEHMRTVTLDCFNFLDFLVDPLRFIHKKHYQTLGFKNIRTSDMSGRTVAIAPQKYHL